MSLVKTASGYDVICDGCLEDESYDTQIFSEAVEYATDDDYRKIRVNGHWENLCSGCIELEGY